MRTILYLLQKEFIQVFRNKAILPLMFVLPMVQLLILVNAATMTVKNVKLEVIDFDNSPLSKRIISELNASPFFIVQQSSNTISEALDKVEKDINDIILVIPKDAEKELITSQSCKVQLLADAVNAQQAQLSYGYISQMLTKLGVGIMVDMTGFQQQGGIKVLSQFWYNKDLNYTVFMFPGILVVLVSMVGMFLSAANLIREKELGTGEQMNVTPVRKSQFIISKLLPFWLLGLVELGIGLVIGFYLYNVPIVGSIPLLFGISAIYLVALLGLGLLMSTISNNLQQVAFISYFFLLIFILMSGIFTSVENMPYWGKIVNTINPIFYYMDAVRAIMLKGAGFRDIIPQMIATSIFAISLLSLSIKNYKKTN